MHIGNRALHHFTKIQDGLQFVHGEKKIMRCEADLPLLCVLTKLKIKWPRASHSFSILETNFPSCIV